MRPGLPSGDVTLLFTDIEGSTALLQELGAEGYADALAEHRRALRDVFRFHGGVEVDTQGDAFFIAFPDAGGAVQAAAAAQEALAASRVNVRMGLHTGRPHVTEEGYVGDDVHKGARIAAAGHGGQVLLSKETRELVDAAVEDLGEHRLKDFAQPVWIFQLGTGRFPPLKTISNTNLPRPASSFVGREHEVGEVRALIREGSRLVTLTGPGGAGKTRLAIEAAGELVPDFANGVFWVGLATIRDPALVVETVAQTLGAKDGLAEYLGEREVLLLLDNLEQVVAAAPELATLVEACPNLRVVATSRERLRVRGEVEYAVPPLASQEAVDLFCARARVGPDEMIAELCARLDNLPLAVELAAARTSVLSPAQILERLGQRLDLLRGGRDADARQQTLRATIVWSHDLLDETERRLFARLSVFAGGCTVADAEAVLDADLVVLESLVDKSLVRQTGERFWMLETIREYAVERLEESGQAEALRGRHAERFLALAEATEPAVRMYSKAALDLLERELDNLRAALDWYEATVDTQRSMRLAASLAELWGIRGHFAEGRRRLDAALAADDQPTTARAKTLTAAADLAPAAAEATARAWAEEALTIYRNVGNTWGAADALLVLGSTYEGDWARARDLWSESARLFAETGDHHHTLMAKRLLAWSFSELGDRERARVLHGENLREARTTGDEHMEAQSLEAISQLSIAEGRGHEALPLIEHAYRIHARLDDPFRLAIAVGRFSAAAAALGEERAAATLLSCSDALLDEMGASTPWVVRMNEETLAAIRGELDDEAFAAAWEQGRALSADEALAIALSLPQRRSRGPS
jgi:predicted ATPase